LSATHFDSIPASPNRTRPRVLVAMSGGVDSAVAAARIKAMGYPVLGVTMKLWDYADVGGRPDAHQGRCCSLEAIDRARRSADTLGIPYYVMDLRVPFRRTVIADFVAEYRAGRTPNPCIVCNRAIKWSSLHARARQVGAERLATGHYARVRYSSGTDRHELLRGLDPTRDQSYALHGLTQAQLAATIFPLGEALKKDVREEARALGLAAGEAPESREICFIADDDYRRFLNLELDARDRALRPGPIIDERGCTVGEHHGFVAFTVGQRRGLQVALGRPYFVRRIDPETRAVHIAPEPLLYTERTRVGSVNWVSIAPPGESIQATVKIRYQHKGAPAILTPQCAGVVEVQFDQPQRALTPGQSAVFYDGERVLGGGLIESDARPGGE
jgi:tRNA-specific 2-thiouridylase